MESKSPKAKKKSDIAKLYTWGKMLRTPLLILFLLGTSNCNDSESDSELTGIDNPNSNFKMMNTNVLEHRQSRQRHGHIQPNTNSSSNTNKFLSDVKYLRRHLNKEIINFVMTDVLVDGEVENRLHYNGITAKETYVGTYGNGIRLRQLTDGRHFVQLIYTQNGDIQDCEYIPSGKTARNFLKTLRKELKEALNEQSYRFTKKSVDSLENEKLFQSFGNISLKILKDGETLPRSVSSWLDYDKLKMECLERHEQLKYMLEDRNKYGDSSFPRSRRSLRENFILPGTKWCGAGQLAEKYNELGGRKTEDRCCRAHDNCKMNIQPFRSLFGLNNPRFITISHCRCDRRFRACLKLADTSVSNMVGKLFFNVVQTKCFVIKPVKSCVKRSWWGKCLKKGHTRQAFERNNLPY